MVTKDGEPKLLDFGISKLLDAEAEDGAITHLGAMTPIYASPEQLKGEPVTTATDVYSLGVVLFKILTGSLPYTLAKGNNGNRLKEVSTAAPTLPSEVASFQERETGSQGDKETKDLSSYISPFTRLPFSPSQLKGDLDNIVLKALRLEPARRYQTVEQFSADIWRFVDGMPVLARPATLRYRASKFYGRNKVAVLAAALIVVSLFLGIAVALSQAKSAREQARIAGQERDAARRASERAERTSRFMQSFLDYANPRWYGRGKGKMDVTVREAIDDAAGRIDAELADELEVRADLHYTIGQVYATHDVEELYLSHMRQSYQLYRQALGEEHPKVARALYYLSMAMHGNGSDLKEVSMFLREGIGMMRRTDPDNINLPHMLQQLASFNMSAYKLHLNESELAEAESMILEAKTLFTRHYGENHTATISAEGSLAKLAMTRGDLNLAENLFEENARRYQQWDKELYGYLWAICYLAEVKLALGKLGKRTRYLSKSWSAAAGNGA